LVGLLLILQTGCFAAGIWLQHFCIGWTTRESLWKRDVNDMAEAAASLGAQFDTESKSFAQIADLGRTGFRAADGWGVALVNDRWEVLARSDGGSAGLSPGQRVPWRDLAAHQVLPDRATGVFSAGGIGYYGVAQPLSNQRMLLVHRSETALEADIAAVLTGLGRTSATTLLWTAALMGICGFVVTGRFCDELDGERSRATMEALRQRQNLIRTRDAVIFGLAKLTESRDPETGDHLDRISMYATTLATELMNHPDFKETVTPAFVRLIGISAALHDIGKVGVEDKILLKPGKLTASERATMEDHSRIGGECLTEIERRLGQSNFLQMARDIAFAHHERWDGSGYPFGLMGEEIPLAARIVAVADVYDALSSRRVYKEPQPHEACVETILEGSGTHFDPRLIQVWRNVADRFRAIRERCSDRRTQVFDERTEAVRDGRDREYYRTLIGAGEAAGDSKGMA
jgi:HD-GYP domain-containing protein (c-di-GMP phosphodiesterase class II)